MLEVVAAAGPKTVGLLKVDGDARHTERRLLQTKIAVAEFVLAAAGIHADIPRVVRGQVEMSLELAPLAVGDVVVSHLRLITNLHQRRLVQVRAAAIGELRHPRTLPQGSVTASAVRVNTSSSVSPKVRCT